MRKKTDTKYLIIAADDEKAAADTLEGATDELGAGTYRVFIGRIETVTVEQKTVITLGGKPERKSRTRQTARGSVTTVGDVPKRGGRPKGSKNKPKVEAAPNPVVVANGKSEHVSEAQS